MPRRNPPDPRYQKLSKEAAQQLIAEDTGALVGFLFSREMENRNARDRITEGYPEAPKYKKGGNLKQQAAIAIAMKKAGKKPKSMEKGGRTKKIKPIKMSGNVDFGNKDYVDFDMPRDQARKAFARVLNKNAGRDALDLKGFNDTREFEIGNLPGGGTRFFLSSLAPSAKNGMKFNPKYTRGSSNVGKRKKLMSEISNIYKQHRGTKAKRQKKGFPPAVAARLKQLMKQRDKI